MYAGMAGAPGALSSHTPALLCKRGDWPWEAPQPPRFSWGFSSGLFPLHSSWILGRAHGGSNECPAPGAEDLVGTRGLSPPADRGCDVMGERGQGRVPSGEVGLMES